MCGFSRRVSGRRIATHEPVTECRHSRRSAATHRACADSALSATYNRAMPHLDRRDFLGTLSLAGLTGPIIGASSDPAAGQDSATDVRRDVTRSIARYVIATRHDELPAAVRKEACAHAPELGRLRRRRLAARDAGCRDRRARAVLRSAAGFGARPPRAAWTSCTRR